MCCISGEHELQCLALSDILKAEVFNMAHDSDYARRLLGLLVKQAREEKEWNQQYLADELDIAVGKGLACCHIAPKPVSWRRSNLVLQHRC